MLKDKEKTLKEQEKNHTKGDPKGVTMDSSSETMGTGRRRDSIFQGLAGQNTVKQELDPRDLLPYSLYDFKDFRETMDATKGYLTGRFDAVPIITSSVSTLKQLLKGGK